MSKKDTKVTIADWLKFCESRIAARSTRARTRGKYKGHASTDSYAWIKDLVIEAQSYIKRTRRGIAYDENMALGSLVGLILVTWYCNVHRAKTYDPNRPVKLRRRAARQLAAFKADLIAGMASDKLMAEVWSGQEFNPPWGPQAKGGKFV